MRSKSQRISAKSSLPAWCDPPFVKKVVLNSPDRKFVLGEDDQLLEKYSIENLIDLEQQSISDSKHGDHLFVAFEEGKHPKPRAIYSATHMYAVIKSFNSQFGRHYWVSGGDESQIGVPRFNANSVIRISKIEKTHVNIANN